MKQIINEVNDEKYAVKVHGKICSPSYATIGGAEDMIKLLSEAHQSIAEIVAVTADGKEILFG